MLTEFLGGTLLIHGLVGSEAAGPVGQAILVIGALAIIARIKMKSRSRRI
jgi:hypothetical protein